MNTRLSGALAGSAVVAALLVATGASASPPLAGPPGGALAQATTQVRLVTGDVVSVMTSATGRQTASVARAHPRGLAGMFRTFSLGHDLYVVPQSAAPYLGSTLDPRLFDVTWLAQHPQASLRANVTLRPGAGAASLPGATLQRASATSATATFGSGRPFGRALARQAIRDHASPTHTTGLFKTIARISAFGRGVEAKTRPGATHTLTVDGTDWNGNPDNGDSVNVYNVDDLTRFATTLNFSNGVAQATVPDGHYSVLTFFYDFNTGNIYELSIPQFTVTKNTTVSIDARDANAQVSVTTPKPATPQIMSIGIARTDALGQTGSYTFLAGAANTFFAQPTKQKPPIGQFHYYVYTRQYSSASKKPYTYDLKFPNEGTIKADQSYAPEQGSLATIDAAYPADHPDQLSLDGRFAALPWETFLFAADLQFTAPTARTEYYTARPDLQWEAFDYSVYTPNPFTLLGEIDTAWEAYRPGLRRNEAFRKQPTHPRLLEHAIFPNFTVCPVCAAPNNLDVLAFPFADNSPFHRSYPDSPTGGLSETTSWSVKADGKQLASGTGVFQSAPAIPTGAKSFSLTYDETRSSADFLLSTDTRTTWTVQANAPQRALPDGWVCDPNGATDCRVLPVMSNRYYLPLDLLGRIPSGDREGSVLVTHLAGLDVAVKNVSIDLSYDGGSTWTAATVTGLGHGLYSVAFTVPGKSQTDGYGAIRMNTKDAAGGSLSQTILKAFSVR